MTDHPLIPLPSFPSRIERPAGLLGRSEWKKKGRIVLSKSKPIAEMWNDGWGCLPLYSFEQTNLYAPTPRTQAVDAFWSTFVTSHNKGVFIRRLPGENWKTFGKPDSPIYLRHSDLTKHLSGAATFGIRGGAHTQWGIIDLDLHFGDKAVFMDQFRLLLSAFHGLAGWHFHVGEGGVHLCQVFSRMPVVMWRHRVRRTLRELDEQHPELAEDARRAGMKTLAESELYPDPRHGVRLPLSAGRTVLIDKPLQLVTHRKKLVQDVIRYMEWVKDENKAYMPVMQVLDFARNTVKCRDRRVTLSTNTAKAIDLFYKHPPSQEGVRSGPENNLPGPSLKGRFAQELVAFWNGKPSAIPNIHHAVIQTARMLPYELDDPQDAIDLLHEYVEALPVLNSQSYSDPKQRDAQIRSRVQKVYHGDGWLKDVEGAARKLARTASAWHSRGFYISRKETWADRPRRKWQFAEKERAAILRLIRPVLKCDDAAAISAVERFVGFVSLHSRNAIPITAIPTILDGLPIRWGKHGKAGRFVRVLKGLGWIDHSQHRFVPRGSTRKGHARRYWIGEKLRHHFADDGEDGFDSQVEATERLKRPRRAVVVFSEIGTDLLDGNPPTVPCRNPGE
jgi:hypothetical protein